VFGGLLCIGGMVGFAVLIVLVVLECDSITRLLMGICGRCWFWLGILVVFDV